MGIIVKTAPKTEIWGLMGQLHHGSTSPEHLGIAMRGTSLVGWNRACEGSGRAEG